MLRKRKFYLRIILSNMPETLEEGYIAGNECLVKNKIIGDNSLSRDRMRETASILIVICKDEESDNILSFTGKSDLSNGGALSPLALVKNKSYGKTRRSENDIIP